MACVTCEKSPGPPGKPEIEYPKASNRGGGSRAYHVMPDQRGVSGLMPILLLNKSEGVISLQRQKEVDEVVLRY